MSEEQIDIAAASVEIPAGTFLLGHDYDWIHPSLRERDERRGYCLESLLHETPPAWVYLPKFRVARRMVSNGEYLKFLHDPLYENEALWTNAWGAFPLAETRVCLPSQSGRSLEYPESFTQVTSAIDAHLVSLEGECSAIHSDLCEERAQGSGRGEAAYRDGHGTVMMSLVETPQVGYVFSYARGALAAIPGAPPCEVTRLMDRIDQVLEAVREHHQQHVERHLRAAAQQFPGEPELFLLRLKAALEAKDPAAPLALRDVIYPRTWRSPAGEPPDPLGLSVPWEDRPVTGVTLFEAIAYCIWLEVRGGRRARVGLPSEAQYERVAGWRAEAKGPLLSHKKELYPWGDDGRDFSDTFSSGEVFNPASLDHMRRQRDFEAVVNSTARVVGDDQVEMLLGFGWHWTCDRYEPNTAELLAPCSEPDAMTPADGSVVHSYEGCSDRGRSLAAVRGAPPLLGGPGLSTRRFAFRPLRAFIGLGFRWVAWGEE